MTTRRARRGLRLAARLFVGAVVGTLAGMTVAIVTSSGTLAGPPEPPAGRPLPAAAFTTRERVDVVDRQAPQPRRIMIWAIGLSSTGHYTDNTIVYAERVAAMRKIRIRASLVRLRSVPLLVSISDSSGGSPAGDPQP